MKTPSRYVKITLMAYCVILLGCTQDAPVQAEPESPYEQYYWVMAEPDWPEGTIEGTYAQTSGGFGYTVDADSLYWEGRESYPVRILRNGDEVWLRTPGNAHTFRGAIGADAITGYMIAERPNGRPGPRTHMTLRRVQ